MKKILKFFLFLLLLSGIISVFWFKEDIKKLPIFYLNKIILSKIEHYDEAKIIKLITPEEKTSVFKVDIDEIKQKINSLPWVKNVNITRILPNKLFVTIEEHKIQGIVLLDKLYFYNSDYKIFIESDNIDNHIIFSGFREQLYETDFNSFRKQITEMEFIVSKFKNHQISKEMVLSEIRKTKFKGYEIISKNNNEKIIIGNENINEILDKSYKILRKTKEDNLLISLIIFDEFKDKNKVLVKLKEGQKNE